MMSKVVSVMFLVILASASLSFAQHLEKGDKELAFRLRYTNLDFDHLDNTETAEVRLTFAYMLTNHHEILGFVGYLMIDSFDDVNFGASYHYNFRAGDNLNPYVAPLVVKFAGDTEDTFDWGYGVEVGVKVYPWSHGGFLFGLNYVDFQGEIPLLDATQFNMFGGLTVKF